MQRRIFFILGSVSYALFLAVYAYMAGFVGNFLVPKSIDLPAANGSARTALAIDLLLLAAFAVPHSVMARPTFKRWWTQFVPVPVERSVYVMVSNILMILLLAFWRPMNVIVFDLHHPAARAAIWSLFAVGWLLVPASTLMIDHFDLFGARQVWLHLRETQYTSLPFRTPMLYRFVRHPLYVGWIIAFWATPTMTAGHLLLAVTLTTYIFIAIPFEERNLIEHFGESYANYRRRVGGLIPRWPAGASSLARHGALEN